MNATMPYSPPADIDVRRSRALVIGAGALLLCAVGFFLNRDQFFRAWLIGYMLWLGVALGSMGWMMIHHLSGGAWGMVVQRGMRQPPSFMEDRLRNAAAGYFFDVMTHGFGAMQDYAAQIPVEDRWAIVAYERALQFSQHAAVGDVPDDRRPDLDRPAQAAGEAPRPEAR